MKLLSKEGLKARGIDYSRSHLWRLIEAGKFPKPVKGGGRGNHWLESEIDEYIRGLADSRPVGKAA